MKITAEHVSDLASEAILASEGTREDWEKFVRHLMYCTAFDKRLKVIWRNSMCANEDLTILVLNLLADNLQYEEEKACGTF